MVTVPSILSLKTPRGESAQSQERPEEGATGDELFRVFAYLVGALVLGTLLDGVFVKWQITLPTYISAMIIGPQENSPAAAFDVSARR